MNEQNTPILDESSILEELRLLGVGVNQTIGQIAELETMLDSKMQRVRQLHQLYSTRSLMVASVAGSIIEENREKPKSDRRRENNPIKNINIGVNLSYRHSKAYGYDALDALERATTSIVKRAIGNGLHSKQCPCGGQTDNCAETKFLVTDADSLPEVVQQKLRQCFQNYENETIPKAGYVSWAEGTEMEKGKKGKKKSKKGKTLTA